MRFDVSINALPVSAVYDDDCVEELFLPLLRKWTEAAKRKKRYLVFLAAPPGAGKSTLAEFLKSLSEADPALEPLTVIGMDGFHRMQADLLAHSTVRGGKTISLVDVKGCPETFRLEDFRRAIERVKSGDAVGWPVYDRLLHDPVENAVTVTGRIVLLEGNYLLLDRPGWRELAALADYTLFVSAAPDFLRERLVTRRMLTGVSRADSEAFVDFSDMANARLCLEAALPADTVLEETGDGSYVLR